MDEFFVVKKRIKVAEFFGGEPRTAEQGEKIAREIGSRILLLIDFENVDGVGSMFMLHTLEALQRNRRQRYAENAMWAIINANPEICLTALVITEHMSSSVVYSEDAKAKLLGATGKRIERNRTFAAAQELTASEGMFTTNSFAKHQNAEYHTANKRLRPLFFAGALGRKPLQLDASRTKWPDSYKAILDEDLT